MNIKPGTISFELVESIFLDENDELVTWNVEQIKELGIDIEIDDFGTGHASIVSLLKLKPRRLKIDRQLITPDRRLAGAAAARRLDHRDRQVARHRGAGRGRRNHGARARAEEARLQRAAGLRLRAGHECRRPQGLSSGAQAARRVLTRPAPPETGGTGLIAGSCSARRIHSPGNAAIDAAESGCMSALRMAKIPLKLDELIDGAALAPRPVGADRQAPKGDGDSKKVRAGARPDLQGAARRRPCDRRDAC